MDTKDILLFESGDGGEIAILNNDLVLSETMLQQSYLALFGGNIEANTIGNELINEQRFDWWGNSLFFPTEIDEQFNSNTERALNKVVLNSSGRLSIIRAVNEDLEYLNSIVNLSVNVEFEGSSKIKITINLERKSNQENKILQLVYDNAKKELIINRTI